MNLLENVFQLTQIAKKEQWTRDKLILKIETIYAKHCDTNLVIDEADKCLRKFIGPCKVIVNDYVRDSKILFNNLKQYHGFYIAHHECTVNGIFLPIQ